MAKPKPAKMLAILGRSRRTGRWRIASRSSVLAFLGSCQLDMRHSDVDDESLKMKVTVVLGSATFVLPDGAEVRPSGVSLLSVSSVDVPDQDERSELPVLEIEWTVVFGRLRIRTAGAEASDETDRGLIDLPLGAAAAALPAPATGAAAAAAVGFEDPAEPATPATGAAAVGFEDLDIAGNGIGGTAESSESAERSESAESTESAPAPAAVAVGFEDL
ncbi:MAG: hypothetical protein ACFCVK_03310 [Acidimicrobiales bacterium]